MMVSLGQHFPQDIKSEKSHQKCNKHKIILVPHVIINDSKKSLGLTTFCISRPPLLGPALPPGFKKQDEDEDGAKDDTRGLSGPALPSEYQRQDTSPER